MAKMKVPVQKGKIELNTPKTMKMQNQKEKLASRMKEEKQVRSGETLKKKCKY